MLWQTISKEPFCSALISLETQTLRLRSLPFSTCSFHIAPCVDECLKLQDRAVAYLNETKAQPQCWQICLERYAATAYIEVRFWCLQALHEVSMCSKSPVLHCKHYPPIKLLDLPCCRFSPQAMAVWTVTAAAWYGLYMLICTALYVMLCLPSKGVHCCASALLR